MNFEQLNIITTLSEEKSFSKTANKLHLTTSAVSQAVSTLEKELDTKLFERSKRGAFPTIKGQYIIKKAYIILEKKQDIYTYTSNKSNFPKLKLNIGCIPGINYILIKGIQLLEREYPFLEVSITEENTQNLLNLLKEDKCDFALIAFSKNIVNHNLNYHIDKIVDGSFYFAVNKKSHLAKYEVLDYETIIKEPLALYKDKFLMNYLSHIESKTKKKGRILFKTNNSMSIINSIEENMAITFCPSYTIINDFNNISEHIKLILAVEDKEVISPSLWFLKSKNKSLNEIGEELLKFIKDNIKLSNICKF